MQCHHLDLHISNSTSQFNLSQLNETKERKTKLTQHIAGIHSRRSDHFYYTLTVLIKIYSRTAVFTTTFHTIDVVDDTFFERKKTLRAGIRSQFLLTTLIDVAEDLAIFMAPRGRAPFKWPVLWGTALQSPTSCPEHSPDFPRACTP